MTTNSSLELSDKLREARLKACLNQREAGKLLDVSGPAYNRWELGQSIPAFSDELLDKMTAFLDVTPEEMARIIVASIVAWNGRRSNR